MVEFIDKSSQQKGTDINRVNMMAIQGFQSCSTVFSPNGEIVETNKDGHTLTTAFNDDGTITQRFVGEKTITKTTSFTENAVTEVIT